MKKRLLCLMLLPVLLLCGCGREPELPADWDPQWTVVCPLLAAEPLEDFTLNESNDALYLSGIYYATWVTGTPRTHTNQQGEEAQAFDAQIYVIAKECRNEANAESELAQWIAREQTNFTAGSLSDVQLAGQAYRLLPLTGAGEGAPYTHGAAAFAQRGRWAICVEALAADHYGADMEQILAVFLEGFHFSE